MEHDEIYLIDLWRILRREWRWFLAVLAVVLGAAIFFAQMAHPRWEATAWIRPGQLGLAPAGLDPRVEPFQRVVERVQTVEFQEGVLHDLGISPRSREGHLYRGSFDLDPSPYAGLLKLTVRGYSPQQAQRFVQASFEHLQRLHEGLLAEPLDLARGRLQQAQAQLADATAERDRLRQAIVPAQGAGAPNRQDLLFASMALAGSNQEIRELERKVSDLKAELSATYSYQTTLVWPVHVPDRPVYPNRMLIRGAGLVFGLGFGLVAAVARNAWRRAALARSTAPPTSAPRTYAQGERRSRERSPTPP